MASKDRQRQLDRERYERVQARMAEQRAAAKKRNMITAVVSAVAVVAVGVTVVALTGGSKKPATTAAGSTATTAPATTPTSTAPAVAIPIAGCTAIPSGTKAPGATETFKSEPAMTIDTKKTYTMTLATNCGNIVITMDASKTPHTVNSFNFLAAQHYFDDSYCHRLSTSSGLQMLQCGDPTKNPANGSAADGPGPGYTIPDENLTNATYPAGTVAMANTGQANSGSAQFFLVFGDSQLPPSYTPFGKITSGLDILQKVAAAGIDNPSATDGTGYPHQPVMLEKVTVAAS